MIKVRSLSGAAFGLTACVVVAVGVANLDLVAQEETPQLMTAVRLGDKPKIRMLLQENADVSAVEVTVRLSCTGPCIWMTQRLPNS